LEVYYRQFIAATIEVESLEFKKTKREGKIGICFSLFYGFFLRTSNIKAAATKIATMMPITAGRKYMSAIDGAAVGIGVGVAAAGSTLNAVVAVEPQ
jgi:hypothetical protein